MITQQTTPKQESETKKETIVPVTQPIDMGESPYSWTRKAVDQDGFEDLWTVRAVTHEGFTKRVENLKAYLLERGYKPSPRGARAQNQSSAPDDGEEAPLCAIHHKPMQKRQSKQGGFFYSCHEKLEDGSWCPYKPAQKG